MKKLVKVSLEEITMNFLKDPNSWPRWPFLPLVRRNGQKPDYAVLAESKEFPFTLFIVNVFDTEALKNLRDAEQLAYRSFEDIVKDGWVVD